MKNLRVIVCLMCTCIIIGCSSPAKESTKIPLPVPTPTPTTTVAPTAIVIKRPVASSTPSPSVTVRTIESIEEEITEKYKRALNISFLKEGAGERSYQEMFDDKELFLSLSERLYQAQLNAAKEACEISLSSYVSVSNSIETLPWLKLACILRGSTPEQASKLNFPLKVSVSKNEDKYEIGISTLFDGNLFEYIAGEDGNRYLTMVSGYAYSITVLDEEGNLKPKETQAILELPKWAFPLKTHTRMRDTWYADRSSATRRHTGTDIIAPEGTEIYSCTAARVLYVDTNETAGNYVLMRAEDGTEFLYCHMVRLSTFLKSGDAIGAGDLIGHVGNTGNSDTNHLHLSVIMPEGYFLNPYPYLEKALKK